MKMHSLEEVAQSKSLKITVVTPSFNQAAFLQATLDSVSSQDYRDIEHIIVDPGSTDGSVEMIQDYVRANPSARAIIGQDKSQMDAINIGFQQATGDIVCWLNSDDKYSDSTIISEIASIFESEADIDVVYGNGKFVDADGVLVKQAYINCDAKNLDDKFITSIGILQPSLFMRRSAFLNHGPVGDGKTYSFDYEYWVRLLHGGAGFHFHEREVSQAIIHADAKTIRAREASLEECISVVDKYYGFAPIEWVTRLVDCQINQNDGIVSYSQNGDAKIVPLARAEFLRRNRDPHSTAKLMENIFYSSAQPSWELLRPTISNGTWIVTAFDQAYFAQGLTLLSGLYKSGPPKTPKIIFDLGLSKAQRDILMELENVYVLDFPKYAYDFQDWYFSSKSYVYKNLAMQHALKIAAHNDTVIWIDAGVYPQESFNRVIEKTRQDKVFFIDHDDRPNWPFCNSTFTTPECLEVLKVTNSEALAPHLCSCLMGVVAGSTYQALFEDAFIASLDPAVSLGNKHPSVEEQSDALPRDERDLTRVEILKKGTEIASPRKVHEAFGFHGHRQDQSIFSIFAARYQAPISSAIEYCIGSNYSSVSSKLNYTSGGFSNEVVVSCDIDKQLMNSATTHHRGIFMDLAHLNSRNTEDLFNLASHADANSTLPYHPRSFHSNVDETAVVAKLLSDRDGRQHVMLDVGAHVGTSAEYFDALGWSIHCFEPDPTNRAKLTQRFGQSENVRIDPRAVSDKPATGLKFFTSDVSTGISGLHAFTDSHEQTTTVDATTVADIVSNRIIKSVDFLKIDVEGFDLNVLKGVPWDRIKPDVIECEFEDNKTRKMGHTWKDIGTYLKDQSYSVYVSEWHPIIRYGISHDWKCIVPFEDCEMADDAWGNLLAFKADPGIDAIAEAFAALIKNRIEPVKTKTTADPRKGSESMLKQTPSYMIDHKAASPGSKWYSGPARKLKDVSPHLFQMFRFARRMAVHIFTRPLLLLPLMVLAGLTAWVLFSPTLAANRGWLLVALSGATMTVALGYIAQRSFAHAEALHLEAAALKRQLALQQAQINSTQKVIGKSDRRIDVKISDIRSEFAGENKKIHTKIASSREESAVENKAFRFKIAELQTQIDTSTLAEDVKADLERAMTTYRSDLDKITSALTAADEHIAKLFETTSKEVGKFKGRLDASEKFSTYDNAEWFQHFNRSLTNEHIRHFESTWRKRLSVPISRPLLGYMADRICRIERELDGRLATTVEDMLLRTLVAKAVKGSSVNVLEIGTLFGTGAAIMYDGVLGGYENIHFTLLDPLEGYYHGSQADILTGQIVDEAAVRRNLARVGMDESEYTLIKHLSIEPEAMEKASQRQYDVLVIDGDHSYAGVKTDFENYAKFVKVGGYIIFDDYSSPDWPEVQEYVDSEIENVDFVASVGSSWRTCVFRVVKSHTAAEFEKRDTQDKPEKAI